MSTLRTLASREAFGDRSVSLSLLGTLAVPTAAIAALAAPMVSSIGGSLELWLLALFDPLLLLLTAGVAAFAFLNARSAFSAASARRSERYRTLSRLGATDAHFRRLLRWEAGAPALLGVLVGAAAGAAIASTGALGPTSLIGLANTIAMTALPAALGVWAATHPAAKAAASPQRAHSPRSGRERVQRPARAAMLLAPCSFAVVLVSVLAFSRPWAWTWQQEPFVTLLSGIEPFAWMGIVFGVLGILLGAALVVPWILWNLAGRFGTEGNRRHALRSLANNPERAAGFTAAILVLSTLAVMAGAGLVSDFETLDDAGDRRQIVVSTTRPAPTERLHAAAVAAGNPVVDSAQLLVSTNPSVHAHDLHGRQVSYDVALLTADLARTLELDAADIAFVDAGGVLVDSEVVDVVHDENGGEDVDVRRIRRGGGVGQPRPIIIAGPTHVESQMPTGTLHRFAGPVDDGFVDDLYEAVGDGVWLDAPRSPFDDRRFLIVLSAVAGAMLFSLALAASNLAAAELDEEFGVHTTLGASPYLRPRLLTVQMSVQLAVALAVGIPLGIALFWLVTRGDPSVPSAIVPGTPIIALCVATAAAIVTVRLMHGPADPTLSTRASDMLE